MAHYTLKRYQRKDPENSTVLTWIAEWIIPAADDGEAQNEAKKLLAQWKEPDDYAAMYNNAGRLVWETKHFA
jgi:hypothetical protein